MNETIRAPGAKAALASCRGSIRKIWMVPSGSLGLGRSISLWLAMVCMVVGLTAAGCGLPSLHSPTSATTAPQISATPPQRIAEAIANTYGSSYFRVQGSYALADGYARTYVLQVSRPHQWATGHETINGLDLDVRFVNATLYIHGQAYLAQFGGAALAAQVGAGWYTTQDKTVLEALVDQVMSDYNPVPMNSSNKTAYMNAIVTQTTYQGEVVTKVSDSAGYFYITRRAPHRMLLMDSPFGRQNVTGAAVNRVRIQFDQYDQPFTVDVPSP